jgi:hypothetical protein
MHWNEVSRIAPLPPFDIGKYTNRMTGYGSLAQCVLSMTFALLFRRFDLTPNDTTDSDIEWDDCFASHTRGHLKVSLTSLDTPNI